MFSYIPVCTSSYLYLYDFFILTMEGSDPGQV